jgi:hypothetical protein
MPFKAFWALLLRSAQKEKIKIRKTRKEINRKKKLQQVRSVLPEVELFFVFSD